MFFIYIFCLPLPVPPLFRTLPFVVPFCQTNVCHRLDNCGNCPSTRPERRRAKSECWQSRRVEFSYFALCLCGCVLPVGFSAYPTIRTKKRASGVGHRPFAQKNVLQSSGKSRRTGKGNETIEKTRKNSSYLLCQHSDFGADDAAGCAERDGRQSSKAAQAKRCPQPRRNRQSYV